MNVYKFKLPADVDQHGIIAVLAESVVHAREVAAEYAVTDEAKALTGGEGLWSRWFLGVEPQVFPVDKAAVVVWTEFMRGG